MIQKSLKLTIPFSLSIMVLMSLSWLLGTKKTAALTCNVPTGSYETIQAAVNDSTCEVVYLTSIDPYIENIVINRSVEINGQSITDTVVNGDSNGSVFTIENGNFVTLTHMTIFNGLAIDGGGIHNSGFLVISSTNIISNVAAGLSEGMGGGIYNDSGTIIIDNSAIISNSAGNGGGIYNTGVLTVTASVFRGNIATNGSNDGGGGGVYNASEGNGYIDKSTFESNLAPNGYGGGLLNSWDNTSGGLITITNSLITRNSSSIGGGIANNAYLTLVNCTVSNNSNLWWAGGIYNGVSTDIRNSTIVNNYNGGIGGGTNWFSMVNSIVANNTPFNCLYAQTNPGRNVYEDESCCWSGCSLSDIVADPLLGPLQDNGGSTLTHALFPFSPAVEAGDNSNCPPTDQRGFVRPIDINNDGNANCDIGAYEYDGPYLVLKVDDTNVDEGDDGLSTAEFDVSLWFSHTEQIRVDFETVQGTADPISDFVPISDTLYFNPSEMKKIISIPIVGDLLPEGEEDLFVILSNPINATIVDGEGKATIYESDFRQFLPVILTPSPLIVADFNACSGINNLGGLMGAAYNPPDYLQESYVPVPERGCVARLYFDIVHWSAFWMKLQKSNLSPYKNLKFDVRANSPVPNRIKVELKRFCNNGNCGEISIIYVSGLTTEWQTISIELDDFGPTGYSGISPLSGWEEMEELVFTFESSKSGTKGVVYLDNIIFEPIH